MNINFSAKTQQFSREENLRERHRSHARSRPLTSRSPIPLTSPLTLLPQEALQRS